MKIDKNDFITLNDNIKYLVASKVINENVNYFCLVDIVDNFNIKFVVLNDAEVIEVTDQKLLDKLLKLMIEDLRKELY